MYILLFLDDRGFFFRNSSAMLIHFEILEGFFKPRPPNFGGNSESYLSKLVYAEGYSEPY